jgi:H+/Cl- antiporter ClcA
VSKTRGGMAEHPPGPAPAAAPPVLNGRYVALLAICALMGMPVAIAAAGFTSLINELQEALWTDLPDALGWSEPAAWYVIVLPVAGGLIVAAALLLPGRGGHSPIEGLSLTALPLSTLPGILLAAVGTLAFGLVLGPEAPLIALGLALGLLVARLLRIEGDGAKVLGLAGAFAAISVVLGGPLPSSLVLLEVAVASGMVAGPALLPTIAPGFLAAGTGALAFTGIDDWPGLSRGSLAIPSLADYASVRIVDIAWCIVSALGIAVVVASARPAARRIAAATAAHPVAALLVGGLVVGVLAVAFRAITDQPVDLVLFSGQSTVPATVAETSAGALGLAMILKAVAYAITLGAGFRGGPIFPTIAIGAGVGAFLAIVLPGFDTTPAVVAGIAAAGAAGLRLPISGVVLAAFVVGGNVSETLPIAVIASVAAWLTALAVDRATGRRAPA